MLNRNRRKFLRSLSRTAFVLPFADVLAMAAPLQQQESPQSDAKKKIGPVERSYDARPLLRRLVRNLQSKERR